MIPASASGQLFPNTQMGAWSVPLGAAANKGRGFTGKGVLIPCRWIQKNLGKEGKVSVETGGLWFKARDKQAVQSEQGQRLNDTRRCVQDRESMSRLL